MSDLRTLAEAAIAAQGTDTWTSNALVEAEEAFYGAANPQAVIGLLDERDDYRTFAVGIARMVASPGAEDTADALKVEDLGALEDVVRAEYGNGHAAGDRARFARCKEDLARALGLDVRRAPEWGEMVGRVRRARMAEARWEWAEFCGIYDLWFTAPRSKPQNMARVSRAEDGRWRLIVAVDEPAYFDDLPAALATIRAVLGADVPEIPNERSES